MKTIYKLVFAIIFLSIGVSACTLDIIPDEIDTDKDAFSDKNAARRYLYSCYGYLPQSNVPSGSIDHMTADEVVTAFEHEPFANFAKGNYTASYQSISYWDTFFKGLRQCHIFLNNVNKVPGLSDADKADYAAQVKYLLGYYHYLLARCYGPIILIREETSVTTPANEYQKREPYDVCVQQICDWLDEAAAVLPANRADAKEYGLATSVAAKAIKAKMRLYAASPLFNGNSEFYGDFKDNDGVQLMPTEYQPKKWLDAKTDIKIAIDLAETNGYAICRDISDYPTNTANKYPTNADQRLLRFSLVKDFNSEILVAETRNEGGYAIQNKSLPFVNDNVAWNGVAPTWTMLNRFYTKNGLPYDEDPEYKSKNKLQIVTVDEAHAEEAAVGKQTIAFNLDREPRFYAWVALQGGYYEVRSTTSNGGYATDPSYSNGRLICDFILGGNCSRRKSASGNPRTGNYAPTCYLNKKGVNPINEVSTGSTGYKRYVWPVIRLTDLYLAYAEACIEVGDAASLSEAKTYLNVIRARAGIPTVEASWEGVATLDQTKLRQIVRQERMNEFYLENQAFWDLRRWLMAEKTLGVKAQGLNSAAKNINELVQLTTIEFERKFESPTQYLMPIPIGDINKNENLVNNPGY